MKMRGPNEADRKDRADGSNTARTAAGFVVGILLFWLWQEQSEAATAMLAVAVGIALGVIAFSLSRR